MNQMSNFFGGGNQSGGNFGGPFGNMMNWFGKFRQFMQNPIQAMMGSGMNIPQNIQNNPEAIINYLRSSGQMSDDQYNQAAQFAQGAQNFFGNGK